MGPLSIRTHFSSGPCGDHIWSLPVSSYLCLLLGLSRTGPWSGSNKHLESIWFEVRSTMGGLFFSQPPGWAFCPNCCSSHRPGQMIPAVQATGRSQPVNLNLHMLFLTFGFLTLALSFRVGFWTQEGDFLYTVSMFGLQLCLCDFTIFPSSQPCPIIQPSSSAAIDNLCLN